MDTLFATLTALAVSLALIPMMIRLAPTLGMLDHPNARKIHQQPIPRVGGWGICLGAVAAVLLWLPYSSVALAFLVGALVLLAGGTWDDKGELRASVKLAIQLAAATPAVLLAGLAMDQAPLVGDFVLHTWVAIPLTVLGLAACINASNTSDGLDGLAAGITLLSLLGLLYLGYRLQSSEVLLLTAAAIGGLAGFLRYNTYPATIFMGDSGSQFLGFAVGFLGLAVVQAQPGLLSPWLLLLLVGLPPADLCVVALRRLRRGQHPFHPDKSHIHHRLLVLGFSHSQAVAAIYTIQASFVFFGVALAPSQAWKILLVYGLHLVLIYGFLHLAEQAMNGRQRNAVESTDVTERQFRPLLVWAPRIGLELTVPLVLVTFATLTARVPRDFALLAGVLLIPLLPRLFRLGSPATFMTRVPVFMVTASVLYLYTENRPFVSGIALMTEMVGMLCIAILAVLAVTYSPMRRAREFRTTALDLLLVILAALAFLAVQSGPLQISPLFLLYAPVLLYGCELLLVERRDRREWLLLAVTVAALILLGRGLLP